MLLPLPSTCYNMFSIEMINPNYMTHLDHVDRIIITWSEMGDSNSRHLAPKASALPTALIPDFWLLSFAPDVVKHVVRRFF